MPWQIQNTSPNHCLLRLHKLHYYTASYAHSAKMWHSARDAASSVCNHVLGEGLDAPGEGAIWGAPLRYGLSSKFFDHLSHVSTAKWLYAHHDADITSELATREYGQNICWPCAPNKQMHHCSCRIDTRPMLYVARIITNFVHHSMYPTHTCNQQNVHQTRTSHHPIVSETIRTPVMAVQLVANLRPSADGSTVHMWLTCRQPAYL